MNNKNSRRSFFSTLSAAVIAAVVIPVKGEAGNRRLAAAKRAITLAEDLTALGMETEAASVMAIAKKLVNP